MTNMNPKIAEVVADIRTYAQAIRTSPTCSCNECDLCTWLALDPETFADHLEQAIAAVGGSSQPSAAVVDEAIRLEQWERDSMRHLAYSLNNMTAVSFSRELCDDVVSWLTKLSADKTTAALSADQQGEVGK